MITEPDVRNEVGIRAVAGMLALRRDNDFEQRPARFHGPVKDATINQLGAGERLFLFRRLVESDESETDEIPG